MSLSPDDATSLGPSDQQRLAASTVRLGTQALVLLLGNAFTLCVGLPLQIYVARVLGASGLGTFALIDAITGFVAGLLAFGIAPTVVRFIPQHLEKGEFASIRLLLRRGVTVLALAGAIGCAGMLLFMPLLLRWWPDLAEYRSVIDVMALLIPLGLLMFFFQQGLRGFQEIRYLVFGSSMLQLTVKALVTVVLLAWGFGLVGYATAVVTSTTVALVWMSVGLWRKAMTLPQNIESNLEKSAAGWRSYALVMYSNSLLGLTTGRLDRFVLAWFFGSSPLGVWSVVNQLYVLPNIILNILLAASVPMFSAAHAREDGAERQHLFHLVTDWSVRAALPLILFFFIFGDLLLRMYGEEFARSGTYGLWVLSAAQVVNLGFGPLGYMLNTSGLERSALRLATVQALLTVAGLLILVPIWGLNGTAITFACAIVFINFTESFVARRKLGLRWWSPRYAKWLLPTVIASAAGMALRTFMPTFVVPELVGGFLTLYLAFHIASMAQGLHQDDRVLFVSVASRIRSAVGLRRSRPAPR